jgi:hypothetical protein
MNLKIFSLIIGLFVWGIGCFAGYLIIAGINKIIKMPRLSGVIVFIGCIIFGAQFGLLGYVPDELSGKIAGAFMLGVSVPSGVVLWTGDEVLSI